MTKPAAEPCRQTGKSPLDESFGRHEWIGWRHAETNLKMDSALRMGLQRVKLAIVKFVTMPAKRGTERSANEEGKSLRVEVR
jgi:hypothetical protein